MNYSDIKFCFSEGHFKHNVNEDFALFALWKDARPFRDSIRNYLITHFEVLLETEVEWSEEYFYDNAMRLYEAPIKIQPIKGYESGHTKKIGDRKFVVFVVKDRLPMYTFAQSVSGKVELSNLNIVKAKYTFRDWVKEEVGSKYAIHSTNSLYEFCVQVPMIFGVDVFKKLIKGDKLELSYLKKDLEGAKGWRNYSELFSILNTSCNYLVQRGFEDLPDFNQEKDIDLLTDNYQRLASIINLKQKANQLYKGFIEVNNEKV